MPFSSTDHNLLFGVLALQADLLDAARFAEACAAWAGRKDTSLADLLVERGWITSQDKAVVEHLLRLKLQKHDGDAQASLAAAADPEVRRVLTNVSDPDIQQSIAGLAQMGGHALIATVAYQPEGRERYTLTHLHASGGIGRVWLAHDSDLGRDVALKELRPDRSDQPEVWARFIDEAKITGQLEHPGIVPVYELVRGDDQRAFYTMRFVRGQTLSEAIKAYHRRRALREAGPLELRELLGAFVGTCNAVAYAHSRGVIHRDLKGQNVVLGDFGEVMLLDWGLAKVMSRQPEESAGDADAAAKPVVREGEELRGETIQGQVLGTPAYMSPEQAEGRQDLVDARSDVYGLGALLYEILAGQPPFHGTDTQEVLQKVIHEPPQRPRALIADVSPGLEAICLRALSKRRRARYESAKALADEVRHWLADEPVSAYREPWTARARRWMSRHHALVTASAAAVLVATLSLTAATVLLADANHRTREALLLAEQREQEAAEQRDQAQANFQLARDAVDEYCTKVSDDPRLKGKDLEELRRQLLQTAAKFHEKFVQRRGEDPRQKLDLGRAYLRLARLTGQIGDREKSLALHEQALATLKELHAEHPDAAEYREELAGAHDALAGWLNDTRRMRESDEHYQRSFTLWEKLAEEYPQELKYAIGLGGVCCDRGDFIRRSVKPEDGLTWFTRAEQVLEPVCQNDKDNERALLKLATTYECHANNLRVLSRSKEGIAVCLRGLALRERLSAKFPNNPHYDDDRSRTLHVLALLHEQAGENEKAVETLKQALAIVRRASETHPTVTLFRQEMAGVQLNLANAYKRMNKPTEAIETMGKALVVFQELVDRNPTVLQYQLELALAYQNLGFWDMNEGKLGQASDSFRHVAELLNRMDLAFPRVLQQYQHLTNNYYTLFLTLAAKGQAKKMEDTARPVLEIRQRLGTLAPEKTNFPVELGGACCNVGLLLGQLKQHQMARESFDQAIRTLQYVLDKDKNDAVAREFLANSYNALGGLYQSTGKPDEAEKAYRLALPLREQLVADHPKTIPYQVELGNALIFLAIFYQKVNKLDQASECFRRVTELLNQMDLAFPRVLNQYLVLTDNYLKLVRTLAAKGQAKKMADATRLVLAIRKRLGTLAPEKTNFPVELGGACCNVGLILGQLKQHQMARESFDQAIRTLQCALNKDKSNAAAREFLINSYNALGSLHQDTGKTDEAVATYEQTYKVIEKIDAKLPSTITRRAVLTKRFLEVSQTYLKANKTEQAEGPLRHARDLATALVAAAPKEPLYREYLFSARANLGIVQAAKGQIDEAFESFRQAAPLLDRMNPAGALALGGHVSLVNNLGNLGDAYAKQNKPERAEEVYGLAIERGRKLVAARPDDVQGYLQLFGAYGKLGTFYKNAKKPEKAIETYRQQLPVAEQMTAKHPKALGVLGLHGSTYHELGQLAGGLGNQQQALAEFDKAIPLLEKALKTEKVKQLIAFERQWLLECHWGRANALIRLQRFTDAAVACDRALELVSGRAGDSIRIMRAFARIRAGEHTRPVAETEELVGQKGVSGAILYDAACILSLASTAANKDEKLKAEERKALAERYATRAVVLLTRTKTAGFFKNADNVAHMKKDTDLDPLRQRDDYKQFLRELEKSK
jgi:serine/threonine-protein kinase